METLCRAIEARSHEWGLDPLRTAARLAREVQDTLGASPILRAGQRLSSEGYAGPGRHGWPFLYWQEVFGALFARAACDGLIKEGADPAGLGRFVADVSAGAFITSLGITILPISPSVCAITGSCCSPRSPSRSGRQAGAPRAGWRPSSGPIWRPGPGGGCRPREGGRLC